MKSVVAIAVAYAGLVMAQQPDLPACAQQCVNPYFSGGSGYAGCGTNAGCICANSGFIAGVACCLNTACAPSDQTSAVVFAQSICAANGVTVPSAVSCVSTAASGSNTASTTAPASAGASPTTSGSAAANTGSGTGSSASAAQTSASSSHNFAAMPRPTGAALGALGGIVAAVALL